VGGQNLTGGAAADLLGKNLKSQAVPGPAWPSFSGEGSDRRMAAGRPGGLKKLWEFVQPTGGAAPSSGSSSSPVGFNSPSRSNSRFNFLTFPAVAGDRIWTQGPRNLTMLSRSDGRALWDQQDFVLARDEQPSENTNPRTGGIYYRSNRPVQAAPAVEGHLLVSRVPLALGERDSVTWPADFAIAVFDTRNGTQLWRKIATGEGRAIYFNLPALKGNAVITGTATYKGGITEYNASALDVNTGEPLWSTYLGGGSDPMGAADGSPALVRDGLVWIESSLYTLSALDLLTGEVRLIYRYTPERRSSYRGGFDSSPPIAYEPLSLIGAPPPSVDGKSTGPIVFVPRWGTEAVGIDPVSGKLEWTAPKAPEPSTAGSLFAVDGKRAYICGEHLQAINLEGGARAWQWDPQFVGSPMGYAALLGDRIYVPIGAQLHVRSAADGQEIEVLDLSEALGDADTFASLVAVDGMLLFSTRERLVALGPK
jgi:outer membrane protein assembly factor BamB